MAFGGERNRQREAHFDFGAEGAEVFARFGELDHAGVAGIGDPDVAFGVDGEAVGVAEVAGFELADVFAVAVEVLDAAIFRSRRPKRLPVRSKAMPAGCLNWPLPEPSVPKAVE